ncbi:hypothetical protein D3C73_1651180 [compost metagenome]
MLCRNLKTGAGFSYVVLVAGLADQEALVKPEEADLLIWTDQAAGGQAKALVTELWRSGNKREFDE